MKDMRLGKLQGILWITPRSLGGWSSDFENRRIDPSSVVFFEGRFSGVKSNEDHVSKAWDFSVINSRYSDYLDFVSRMTKKKSQGLDFPLGLTKKSSCGPTHWRWIRSFRESFGPANRAQIISVQKLCQLDGGSTDTGEGTWSPL